MPVCCFKNTIFFRQSSAGYGQQKKKTKCFYMENLIHRLKKIGISIDLGHDRLRLHIPDNLASREILEEVKLNRQELIAYLKKKQASADFCSVKPRLLQQAPHYGTLHNQQKEYMRFLLLGPHSYNMNFILRFDQLDRTSLESALETVLQRHESLRTTLFQTDGEIRQRIHDLSETGLPVEYIDLSDRDDFEQAGQELFGKELSRRFDLGKEIPVAIKIARYTKDTYFLSFTIHHISCDDASLRILKEEIGVLYEAYKAGRRNPLPPLLYQYKEYADWVKRYMDGGRKEASLEFYRQRIGEDHYPASYRQLLEKELDRAVGKENAGKYSQAFGLVVNLYPGRGGRYHFFIQETLLNKVKDFAARSRASFNMTLTAVFCMLLQKITNKRQIRLYMPFSTRVREEFQGIVGWLTSEAILCMDITAGMTLKECIAKVTETLMETANHRLYPHEAIMQELDLPLYLLAPFFLNFPEGRDTDIADFTPVHHDRGSAHFELRIEAIAYRNGMELVIDSVYSRESIEYLIREFSRLLEEIV